MSARLSFTELAQLDHPFIPTPGDYLNCRPFWRVTEFVLRNDAVESLRDRFFLSSIHEPPTSPEQIKHLDRLVKRAIRNYQAKRPKTAVRTIKVKC